MKLLPIVEGEGDLAAVPALVRHVLAAHERFDVELLPAQRRGEWPKVKRQFDRYFQAAALERAPVLWILDFDCDECVSVNDERSWAAERARVHDPGIPFDICFMVKEFETLFLADEHTTRAAFPDIPADLPFPMDPEAIRDAKGWLSWARPKGAAYKPTMHQAKLASQVDIKALRERSPSFIRFEQSLLGLLKSGAVQ